MWKFSQKKIIEYGLYLFAFLLTWQARLILKPGEIDGNYFEYLSISLYAIDILLIILLLFSLQAEFGKFNKDKEVAKSIPLIYWLAGGLELSVFISIFFAQNFNLAFYNYIVFLFALGLFWLLIKSGYEQKKLLYYFFGAIFVQSCLAIWQFLSQSNFSSKWLGMAGRHPGELGVSVIEVVGVDGIAERWLRAYGSLDHPNILGGVLSIALLLMIGTYLKNKKQDRKVYENLAILSIYLISLCALVFSFSRSAWLGFVIGVLSMAAIFVWQKDYFKLKEISKIILVSFALLLIIFSQYSLLFKTRLTAASRLETKSVIERIASVEDSLPIIRNNFWGVGVGNYSLALKEKIPNQYSWYYQPVHNTYLLVWAEIGLFGILFFTAILFYLLHINWKRQNILNTAVVLSLMVMMLFDHWWWSMHFGIYFLFFIFALMHLNKKKD